jgi:hypothetical protein
LFSPNIYGLDDVPSHIAQSVDLTFGDNKRVHVSLIHNPSHLEAANPIAMGKTRAKQARSVFFLNVSFHPFIFYLSMRSELEMISNEPKNENENENQNQNQNEK